MHEARAKATDLEAQSILTRVNLSRFAGKEILITGGSGMVASFLVSILVRSFKLLNETQPRITLLVRDSTSSNLNEFFSEPSVVIEECDLVKWNPLRTYDYLIHAASPASPTKYGKPGEIEEANIGFLRRLETVGFPKDSLLISSGEVYGPKPPNPVPESFVAQTHVTGVRAVYPAAKLAAERMLLDAGIQKITSPKIIRLFHTFGPGMKVNDGRSFADFIWASAKGSDISLRSKGQDIRSFLYLEDAAAGILTILKNGESGEIYNLGSQEKLSILEYATLVAAEANVRVIVPQDISDSDSYTSSPIHFLIPDTTKLGNLGWSRKVSSREGIRRTLGWAREITSA